MTAPDSVMSRLMKLLALAGDESTSPHERKLAEERAERLMAQHMIDRFEAMNRAKSGDTQARKPIQSEWTIVLSEATAEDASIRHEFDYQMIDMMYNVLEHCGVRVNRTYKSVPGGRLYKIVGFQEDIMYAERIWFNVFKTFVNNVNPQWDKSKSVEYNAYNFASAGVSWKSMVLIAEKAGDTRLAWPWRYQNTDPDAEFYTRYSFQIGEAIDPGNKPWGQSIHKLKRACKKYCDDHELIYPYARGTQLRIATRNSFARSYRATITRRLRELRAQAFSTEQNPLGDTVARDQHALALRDTKARVDEEFYRIFPEFDPEVQARRQAAEQAELQREWDALPPAEQKRRLEEQRKAEERWECAQARARRNFGTIREDPADRIDSAAWNRGTKAAASVNLRADEEVDTTTKGELQ